MFAYSYKTDKKINKQKKNTHPDSNQDGQAPKKSKGF